MRTVHIIGGGLSGTEAAWQLADRGFDVRLIEMRPQEATGAHRSDRLAEIVCTNSFKSTLPDTASGMLKRELDILDCRLLGVAREAMVPAGHALAVDRDVFATLVTDAIEGHANITVERRRQDTLEVARPTIVATGPLTAAKLSESLQGHVSSDHLYFYDAIAPSIEADSIDESVGFWASRYDKGDADYFNIPLDKAQYLELIARIREADLVTAHAFEEANYFESCLPIEVMVSRGEDTLRFGPMKPKGLRHPRTGEEPYAAIQLRQESRSGNLLGMVGFQTRMTFGAQKSVFQGIPGLSEARFLRLGSIHRNIFLNIPEMCDSYQRDRRSEGLYYAGQICGVEGYVECITSGLVAAMSIAAEAQGRAMAPIPDDTMIGALMSHIHTPVKNFQPMNANMGILPTLPNAPRGRRGGRKARYTALSERGAASMTLWRDAHEWLFEGARA